MPTVLGVHGIGRHCATSAGTMLAEWSDAMRRGIACTDHSAASLSLSIAYYRHLFSVDASRDLGADDRGLDQAESQMFREMADEVLVQLSRDQQDAVDRPAPTLGIGLPAAPPDSLRAARVFEARWGAGAAAFLITRVRQLHTYLSNQDLSARIRALVAGEISRSTDVLLAHSLGSVVAYDVLRREGIDANASAPVRTLVTFGSPLAWTAVRRRLEEALPVPFGMLTGVHWVNVHDRRDPVTAGAALGGLALGIDDYQVDNGRRDSHGAKRYLRQRALIDAVMQSPSVRRVDL